MLFLSYEAFDSIFSTGRAFAYLVKGYMNATIREDLDLHIMELLEDEWFYQWPLVHWAYASRLLHGVGCRKSNKNKKKAVDILLPMARNGCPGALYDIGCCYMNGWHLEQSDVKAIKSLRLFADSLRCIQFADCRYYQIQGYIL